MKVRKILFGVILTMASGATVFAGMPYEDTLICPVGGQEFEVTRTVSCSTMGRMLTLRPVTSCDFVTRLPICPNNQLPVFDEFDDNDISSLEEFINTDAYNNVINAPKYLRAAWTARHLERSPIMVTRIMGQGLMYDREVSLNYPDFLQIYEESLNEALPLMEVEERPFYLLALAFEHHLANDSLSASSTLDRATAVMDADNAYLKTYHKQVSDCLSNRVEAKFCSPTTVIK